MSHLVKLDFFSISNFSSTPKQLLPKYACVDKARLDHLIFILCGGYFNKNNLLYKNGPTKNHPDTCFWEPFLPPLFLRVHKGRVFREGAVNVSRVLCNRGRL